MQQLLHLLTVNLARRTTLATWLHQRWSLPIIVAPERARIGGLVRRWLQERGVEGQPIGQWLGRASPNGAVDWLMVVDAPSEASMPSASTLCWTPLETLLASQSLLEYQQWAIARVLGVGDLPTVPGPFGDPHWLGEVLSWVTHALGGGLCAPEACVFAHRLGSHEVVLECVTPGGRWFFKGLASDRAAEALITQALARVLPQSFARTAAMERRPDGSTWWLMDACPGVPLIERLTADAANRVVEAYASVQQAIAGEIVASGAMPTIDLPALASRAGSLIGEDADQRPTAAARALIDEACRLLGSDLPLSWVAADLDPNNVVVEGDAVRFIDLDDALIGPAPLAIGTFARRVARALGDHWTPLSTARLVDAYERAWKPGLRLSTLWPAIDLVSDFLECDLAWQRVEIKIARGEVHGVREMAQRSIQQRLLRAVNRYRDLGFTGAEALRPQSRRVDQPAKSHPRESPRGR